MDYKKKIKELKEKIKNEDTLKFIDFLEILYDWLDFLVEKKRISSDQKLELLIHFPKKIFEELEKVSPTELLMNYEDLKELLLAETSDFLLKITITGKVRMVDFDSIQFNLYGIFGKEKIASMVEHVRLKLEEIILKQREEEFEEEQKGSRLREEWLKKIRGMPERELIKLITKSTFLFSPSARTQEERLGAIKNNQKNILKQKKKFHAFELKIIEATDEAKADAELNVNRQVGIVRRKVDSVSEEFKEKAKEFVSDEGPKKMINEARNMILNRREELDKEVEIEKKKFEGKGEAWKKEFIVKVEGAKGRVGGRKIKLSSDAKERRESISNRAESELGKAEDMINKNIEEFESDVQGARKKFVGKAEQVLERGKSELDKSREMIFKEKSEFVGDVEKAKIIFDKKEKEIDYARSDFKDKSDIAASLFTRRGGEIEEEMESSISKGKEKFLDDRVNAQNRFKIKADEIMIKAGKHISGKKKLFIQGRDLARKRFYEKSGIRQEGGIENEKSNEIISKGTIVSSNEAAKSKIELANASMLETAQSQREKMKEKMNKQRELFMYDVRFAQGAIQRHAKEFSEKIAAKREEFGTVQENIVARHKAKQKAHLIRNLLRTIRTMH